MEGVTWHQIGFNAMWLLDNVLLHQGRAFTAERLDTSAVNVMLDVKDATPRLKLAPDGLEMRNDGCNFESVRVSPRKHASRQSPRALPPLPTNPAASQATCCAQGSGLWYYEATVFTAGIMQVQLRSRRLPFPPSSSFWGDQRGAVCGCMEIGSRGRWPWALPG
jgi:hypothetical protein